jgi:stearoyl-CoA desaturase (delta-9 desaturase)
VNERHAFKDANACGLNRRAEHFLRTVTLFTVIVPFLGFLVSLVALWRRCVYPLDLAVLGVMYILTLSGVSVGFHRLVTHRAFQTTLLLKVCICIFGSMAGQGPVLFWAATHRRHHSSSDRTGDPHSPHLHGRGLTNFVRGFWHAHTGWMLRPELSSWVRYVPDLLKDRQIFLINRLYFCWVTLGLLLPAIFEGSILVSWHGFLRGLLWGGFVRIFLVHHVTWSVNSVCHIYGQRPFNTNDRSTNNFPMALLSFGEGWHNNHHAFPNSAFHGLRWWQIDFSGYFIRALRWSRLAWNVKYPSESMLGALDRNANFSNETTGRLL